jgi:hypothetical protein
MLECASVRVTLASLLLVTAPGQLPGQHPPQEIDRSPCQVSCSRLYVRVQDTTAAAARAASAAAEAEAAAGVAKGGSSAEAAARQATNLRRRSDRRKAEADAARDAYVRCVRRCAAAGPASAVAALPGDVERAMLDSPPAKVEVKTVGLVLPADLRAGDTYSALVIPDARRYDGVPGVRVVPVAVPIAVTSDHEPLVESLAVETQEGVWPASTVFTGRVAPGSSAVSVTVHGADASASPAVVDVRLGPPGTKPAPAVSETPASCVAGSLSLVRGAFDGVAATTRINLSGVDATLVVETPRASFWQAPADTPPGAHVLSVTEGTATISRDIAVVRLVMGADDLDLRKGEKTAFRVAVEGLGAIPPEAWNGGFDDELVARSRVAVIAPGVRIPGADQPGLVLLHVENTTRDTITIEKSNKETLVFTIDRRGLTAAGTFEYRGVIKSKKGGPFGVSAIVIPMLAPYTQETGSRK